MKGLYRTLYSIKALNFNSRSQLAHFVHRDYMANLVNNRDPFQKAQYYMDGTTYEMTLRALWVNLCIRYKKYNSDPIIMREHSRLLAAILTSEYIERENVAPIPQCQFCTRLGKCLFCSGQSEWPI